VQETCWGSTDDALSLRDFDEGGWQHAEHSVTTKRVNHISMAMKCSVTPAVLKLQPKEFVNTLREVGGFAINAACAKSCKSWQVLRRNATNFGAAGLAPGQQHTWGGVNTMLESWKVEPLDMHQVYVVGDCLCNVQPQRLVAVLSTENLLLISLIRVIPLVQPNGFPKMEAENGFPKKMDFEKSGNGFPKNNILRQSLPS
jgi:hypothetical protein